MTPEISPSIKEFVKDIPSVAWIKDINFRYVVISNAIAEQLAFPNAEFAEGKEDYELEQDEADKWRCEDKFIHSGKTMVRSAKLNCRDGKIACVIHTTKPYYENNKLIGSLGVGHIVNEFTPVEQLNYIRSSLKYNISDCHFKMNNKYKCGNYTFTQQQAKVMSCILRQKTDKEIGKLLKISYRTVQKHIEALKDKLECNYKAELFSKALEHGFIDLILFPV